MLDACTAGTTNIGRTVLVINIPQDISTALFDITRLLAASLAERRQTDGERWVHLMETATSLAK